MLARFILPAFFFIVLTPLRWLLHLIGVDPMDLRFRKKARASFLRLIKQSRKNHPLEETIAPDTIYPLW